MHLIILIAALFTAPAAAEAIVPTSIKEIGSCMAFYAITNGLDGTKQVDAGTAAVMRDLGARLFEEGSKASMDDSQIQDAVVHELIRLNTQAKQEGLATVEKEAGAGCDDLVSRIRGVH